MNSLSPILPKLDSSSAHPPVSAGRSARVELANILRKQVLPLHLQRPFCDTRPIRTGCESLDQLFPAGGLVRGSLVECLGNIGSGAGTLALLLARQAIGSEGVLIVLDTRSWFYPPAAAVLGIDFDRLFVIRPSNAPDAFWALDQILRCPAVTAVWASTGHLESHTFRRLALAVEQGGGLGLLVRPERIGGQRIRGQPSWSEVQLRIEPRRWLSADLRTGRRIRVEVTRCRRGPSGGTVDLELDERTGSICQASTHHETHPMHMATKLASSASGC